MVVSLFCGTVLPFWSFGWLLKEYRLWMPVVRASGSENYGNPGWKKSFGNESWRFIDQHPETTDRRGVCICMCGMVLAGWSFTFWTQPFLRILLVLKNTAHKSCICRNMWILNPRLSELFVKETREHSMIRLLTGPGQFFKWIHT